MLVMFDVERVHCDVPIGEVIEGPPVDSDLPLAWRSHGGSDSDVPLG